MNVILINIPKGKPILPSGKLAEPNERENGHAGNVRLRN
jgi:hypothetical protein